MLPLGFGTPGRCGWSSAAALTVNVAQRPAINRLAHLLCEMMARREQMDLAHDGSSCTLGLTQTHLSEATGLTAVYIRRTVQDPLARGLITFGQGTLTIYEWDAFARLWEFNLDFRHLQEPTRPSSLAT